MRGEHSGGWPLLRTLHWHEPPVVSTRIDPGSLFFTVQAGHAQLLKDDEKRQQEARVLAAKKLMEEAAAANSEQIKRKQKQIEQEMEEVSPLGYHTRLYAYVVNKRHDVMSPPSC